MFELAFLSAALLLTLVFVCSKLLIADEDLNIAAIELLAFWQDVDADDFRPAAEEGVPHQHRAAMLDPDLENPRLLVLERFKIPVVDVKVV